MSFSIKIDEFEGPLDLMLYLVKENKLDLFNLDLVILTNQYINYIFEMRENNLQVASEYLSEMAGLIEYKSKKLLPRDKSELEVNDDINDSSSLVARLIEYQRYKEVSIELSERFIERQNIISLPSKVSSIQKDLEIEAIFDHDIYDLIKAMTKVLNRHQQSNLQTRVLYQKEFSVDDRIDELRRFLKVYKESFTLESLLSESNLVEYQIVTFLAILDMIRMNELAFSMNNDQIYLKGIE